MDRLTWLHSSAFSHDVQHVASNGGTHLDALLSGIHVNSSYGIFDVIGIHLHTAIAGAPRWWPCRYHRASTAAESLAIAIDLGLFAITEL